MSITKQSRSSLLLTLALWPICGCDYAEAPGSSPPLLLFGRSGTGPLEFDYPRAAASGAAGELFVVDKGGRLQVLSQEGEFLRDWTMPRIDAGKPTGLGVGPNGHLYVADTHYGRVLVFSPTGERLRTIGSFGTDPGQFRLPTDVAIEPGGSFYVSEYGGNDRISRFSPDGTYLFDFGGPDDGPARTRRPQSLVLDADGTLWVTDSCNHRVCHFGPGGELLGTFGSLGGGPGELRFPYGIDRLSDGTLVVCEYGNNRVQRFTPQGESLGVWGAAGRQPGQVAYPWAAVVGAGDRVFVVDSGNNRIQVIDGAAADTWSPLPRAQ
jgi:DNA-binding beta-propeller fold protein YncE